MSVNISKKLSFILRHNPGEFNLTMDSKGWVDVQQLVDVLVINIATLVGIVNNDSKGRYQFNENTSKIRATQGHSIKVDLDETVISTVSKPVYHGTARRFLDQILKEGLNPGTRRHVHMTYDLGQAKQTGTRHGSPVVLEVTVQEAIQDGIVFFESDNGYILSESVPAKYLKVLP